MTKHLEREVDRLKRKILNLSSIVEDSLFKAVRSVEKRDRTLAESVIKMDHEIDSIEVEVEEDCLKILALHQPVAIDLRLIIAALKINNDLERIGDLAVNIADRAVSLSQLKPVKEELPFEEMAHGVRQMLRKSLQALVHLDVQQAQEVCASDDRIDEFNKQIHKQVLESMRHNPEDVQSLMLFISVSRNLERVADHATNIAEDVIYMVDGEIVRHRVAELCQAPV
ncbi:MAG: phosphate signaling complex protein PhoU [Deltaproteobacteria bacterium]|nr:phosphate signaling complex protein PhoU [Deltaproteobacteria bacterium]